MSICNDSDFAIADQYLNLSGKTFCPNQLEPLILEGSLTASSVSYGVLHLNRCDQQSAMYYNVTCKSQDEINLYFQDKYVYIYFSDNLFDLTNLQTPVRRILNFYTTHCFPQIEKTTTISLQKTLIYTDKG